MGMLKMYTQKNKLMDFCNDVVRIPITSRVVVQ